MTSNTNLGSEWFTREVGKGIVNAKYLHKDEEVGDMFERVEVVTKVKGMYDYLYNADFFLAGRSLYGAGCKGIFNASMSNCYVMPDMEDNIESIFDTLSKMARINSYGGGCGVDISKLRPKDAVVNNSARTSTGAVSFLKIINSVGEVIGAHGRRSATMVMLDCSHPDLYEFLHIKESDEKLSSMNISIKFTDEFMKAVETRSNYTLSFTVEATGETIEKEINAGDFFDEFCQCQYDYADPGGAFIDTVRDNNLLSGYPNYKINVSNPCVSGDTLILTDNGYVRIDSVVDKQVNIWNGSEWSKVTPKITGTNQKMKRIKLSNGMSIDCTNYHKFVLSNNTRVKACDLKLGDKLHKWTYPIIEGADTLEHAYTHGFFSGDGTKNRPEIAIYDEKKCIIEYLNYKESRHKKTRDFIKLNGDVIPYNKEFVPSNKYSIKTRLDWLAGIIDSDGCLNDCGGSVAVSSIDIQFLKSIQLMLTTLGVSSSINYMHTDNDRLLPLNDGSGNLGLFHCKDCYRLIISAFNVKRLISIGLNTHRVELIANPNRDASRFIQVIDIEDIDDADTVYCFNEPINHTGIFNGIMTAQCSEFWGNAYNSCNLGSINLYNIVNKPFTKDAHIDLIKLTMLVNDAVIALDNVLDYGYDLQPLDKNRECIYKWRSIGLGIFGLADMFIALGIRYGSKDSIKLINYVMEIIFKVSIDRSCKLAKEKGSFEEFNWEYTKKSPLIKRLKGLPLYDDIKKYGLRNGTIISIAPNGSIATQCGMSTGIEPLFKVSYERTTHSMEDDNKYFKVYAKSVEDLLRANNLAIDMSTEEIKSMFPFVVESDDISYKERINCQSAMQYYVDNAISSTINLPESATVDEIRDAYIYAWKLKLKGITIFRDGCKRGNILGKKDKPETNEPVYDSIVPVKRRDKKEVSGTTYKLSSACADSIYCHVNKTDKGDLFEIFTNPSGGCQSNINTITRLVSSLLRQGTKVEKIIEDLRASKCPACQAMRRQGNAEISLSCGDAMATALEKAYNKEIKNSNDNSKYTVCPKCGKRTYVSAGKCGYCYNCSFSVCEG